MRTFLFYLVSCTLSAFVGFVVAEGGYRILLQNQHPKEFIGNNADTSRPSVWFMEKSRWQYHPDYGYSYGPETISGGSTSGGKVQGCWYWPANERGNMGLIRGDYASAELKVAVFGDSFTAQVDTGPDPKGITWPDYLQDYLTERTGRTVNVLNFGRDGTGLLHMVDLARDKVAEWKPDLVIFSFITDDFTRDRFFRTPTVIDGRERVLTTQEPGTSPSLDHGSDTAIVHSGATKEWCEREAKKTGPSQDPVLLEMEATVLDAKARMTGKPSILAMDRSFLLDRILHGTPFHTTYANALPTQNPRHRMNSYLEDQRFVDGLAEVKKLGIPIALTHLAIFDELRDGKRMRGTDQDVALANSLEKAFGVPVLYTKDYGKVAPERIVAIKRSPNDTHPSVFGMQYYADAVATALKENGYLAR